jgi:hypothetical protein
LSVGYSCLSCLSVDNFRVSHNWSKRPSPSFSSTTFQNFPGIFRTIGLNDLLHPSPAPHFKIFQLFIIYCPKCPSFSTTQSYVSAPHKAVPNVALYLFLLLVYFQFAVLLAECCFCHDKPGFKSTCTSCTTCCPATLTPDTSQIPCLLLVRHNLYCRWLAYNIKLTIAANLVQTHITHRPYFAFHFHITTSFYVTCHHA